MKLFISLLLISFFAQAKLIKIKYQEGNEEKAQMIVRILENKFYIPSLLIQTQLAAKPCIQDTKTIVHLCLDEDNELQMPWIDRERFNFSLSHMIEFPIIDLASTKGNQNELND